jgi:hypothetical protein
MNKFLKVSIARENEELGVIILPFAELEKCTILKGYAYAHFVTGNDKRRYEFHFENFKIEDNDGNTRDRYQK